MSEDIVRRPKNTASDCISSLSEMNDRSLPSETETMPFDGTAGKFQHFLPHKKLHQDNTRKESPDESQSRNFKAINLIQGVLIFPYYLNGINNSFDYNEITPLSVTSVKQIFSGPAFSRTVPLCMS
jgi:hypothetical protein